MVIGLYDPPVFRGELFIEPGILKVLIPSPHVFDCLAQSGVM
jgi:hypothetical protein